MGERIALIFWCVLSRPSYWLYLAGLPNGLGYVSAKVARILLNQQLRARGR